MAHDVPPQTSRWRYVVFAFPVCVFLGTGLVVTARQLEGHASDEGLLDPLPEVTKRGGCAGTDLEERWRSLLHYTPGDDPTNQEVRLSRRGERARLVVVEEGMKDDSVAAQRTTWDLLWSEESGWSLSSCEREPLRCWRGAPTNGACP